MSTFNFCKGPRSIYSNSNMTPMLSGHFSIFGLVFFVLNPLLGIARQWSREKFAILTLKPRSHVRILITNVGYSHEIFSYKMRCGGFRRTWTT